MGWKSLVDFKRFLWKVLGETADFEKVLMEARPGCGNEHVPLVGLNQCHPADCDPDCPGPELTRFAQAEQQTRGAFQSLRISGKPSLIPAGMQVSMAPGQALKDGERVIVIGEAEGIVPKTVVDRINEVAAEADWWTERSLWTEGLGIPDAQKTRAYIEWLEEEAEELRRERQLGDPVEDLT